MPPPPLDPRRLRHISKRLTSHKRLKRRSVMAISPILAVRDVTISVAFYVRYLGFRKVFIMEDRSYGVVDLEGHTLHLTRAGSHADERATRTRIAVYITVERIEDHWRRVMRDPPPTQVRGLITTPWGMREFHVLDPDGCLIRFGEERG